MWMIFIAKYPSTHARIAQSATQGATPSVRNI